MTNNFLLLNSDKTEILLFGPKKQYTEFLRCTVTSSTDKNEGVNKGWVLTPQRTSDDANPEPTYKTTKFCYKFDCNM